MSSEATDKPTRRWLKTVLVAVALIVALISFVIVAIPPEQIMFFEWHHPLLPFVLRQAQPTDPIDDDHFGFDKTDAGDVRPLAIITGTFTRKTWLTASLVRVQSGEVEQSGGFTVGRSPNYIGPDLIDMQIQLAFKSAHSEHGGTTRLGIGGTYSRAVGSGGTVVHDFSTDVRQTFSGRLEIGKQYIAHVEGDRDFSATRLTSIDDFAAQNDGNFLVLMIAVFEESGNSF